MHGLHGLALAVSHLPPTSPYILNWENQGTSIYLGIALCAWKWILVFSGLVSAYRRLHLYAALPFSDSCRMCKEWKWVGHLNPNLFFCMFMNTQTTPWKLKRATIGWIWDSDDECPLQFRIVYQLCLNLTTEYIWTAVEVFELKRPFPDAPEVLIYFTPMVNMLFLPTHGRITWVLLNCYCKGLNVFKITQ